MIKFFNTLLIITVFLISLTAYSQKSGSLKPISEIGWDQEGGITYRQDYGLNRGIDAFARVNDQEFAFLCDPGNRIIIFNIIEKSITDAISLNFYAGDIYFNNNLFYLTGKKEVFILDKDGILQNKIFFGRDMKYIDRIFFAGGKIWFISPAQVSYRVDDGRLVPVEGIILEGSATAYINKTGKNTFELHLNNKNGIPGMFSYTADKELGTVRIIGGDGKKIIVDIQTVINKIPLKIHREIMAFDISKNNLNTIMEIEMPNVYYTYIKNDVIYNNGSIDFMVSAPENTELYSIKIIYQYNPLRFSPDLYTYDYHYNDHTLELPAKEYSGDQVSMNRDPITRPEIIANAEPYDTHEWYCSPENIKDYDCGGVHVTTPSWVEVGTNISVPYMWGGWSTLAQFEQGLIDEVSAGDNYTVGYGSGPDCAVGVDCSGFVSVAWELPYKHSTSSLPNISTEYSDFDELLPGDIVNNAGSHVRLVHTCYGNGSWLIIEASASATNWSVGYSTYTTADLQSSYSPRYYNDVISGLNDITENNCITVYPNPVTGKLFITGENMKTLTVSDISGRVLINNEILSQGTVSVNFARYSKGIYLIKITTDKKVHKEKIIVQ